MIEVVPDLWISNDKIVFSSKEAFNTINAGKNLSFLGKSKEYNNEIKANLEKYELIKLYKYLHDIVITIFNKIKNHEKVVVHCKTSNEFSILVILAYLIKYGNLTLQNSINIIKTKKNQDIILNNNYIYILDKFSKDILLNEQSFNI
jgi:hypothetical protein